MKRIAAILSAVVLLLTLGACAKETAEVKTEKVKKKTETVQQASVTLPLAHNDGLNPYTAKSKVNQALVPLLFDGLYYLNEAFEPQPLIASSGTVDGKTVTVSLNPSARFSDGSAVTADDVTYSFRKAKSCDYYSTRLSGFSSASASGGGVVFTLSSNDIFALSCLDFPIVKQDTAGDEDELPIGCGRFIPDGKLPTAVLKSNENSLRGASSIGEIHLYEITESDGMAYGLEIGNYDYWYDDLASGEYRRINSGVSVVDTNNLVYLAFNSEKSIFTEEPVRQAVSVLLNRDSLVSTGFQGHAAACALPFQPKWKPMEAVQSSTALAGDKNKALEILKSAGYTKVNAYGYRASTSKSLTANLTVCKDNPFKLACAEEIKAQLAKINFHVRLVELSYEDYTKAISKGEFEMYLGEIKLPVNMSLSAFFSSSGAAYVGVDKENGLACRDEYFAMRSGELSLSDFCAAFDRSIPFVPLCYRSGLAMYARSIGASVVGTCTDGFYNINSWVKK